MTATSHYVGLRIPKRGHHRGLLPLTSEEASPPSVTYLLSSDNDLKALEPLFSYYVSLLQHKFYLYVVAPELLHWRVREKFDILRQGGAIRRVHGNFSVTKVSTLSWIARHIRGR